MSLHVAIIASAGLGDGLIQMVIANNLLVNACRVTFFNDHIHELQTCFPSVRARPYPAYERLLDEVADADVVLYDAYSPYIQRMPADLDRWLETNAVSYSTAHAQPIHRSITASRLAVLSRPEHAGKARRLVRLNRSLRDRGPRLRRKPVSRQLADRVVRLLELDRKTYSNGFALAAGDRGSSPLKVSIHPTSSNPAKSWLPERFLELADGLKRDGWNPVITVAPGERARWLELAGDRLAVPELPTTRHLADCLADSAAFVGNDSGGSHLASCMGLPTLMIYKRWRRDPPWRPGWAKPWIVCPHRFSARDWQRHLAVERVRAAFDRMMLAGRTFRDSTDKRQETGSLPVPNE
jgi:hypothetical protein